MPLLLGLAACGAGRAGAPPDAREPDGGGAGGPRDALPQLDATGSGYALSFNGVNDYATAGNGGFPAAGAAQTVALWVNYAGAAATQDFVVMRMDFTSGVQLGIRDGTITVWRTYSERTLVAAPALPAINRWHHVAYTFDATVHALYVDGVMVASSTAASDIRTPSSVWVGTVDGSNELLAGQLDEVRVWTATRSAAEVMQDMHHRPAGAEPGLVAYWTFDDPSSGGRALDSSGQGNDITLGDGVAERMPSRVLSGAPSVP